MIRPGATLELTVERPAAGGRMIACSDGQVILVAGGIPGERVHARVERVGAGVAYAAVTAVIEPSPDRRPAPDDWACGGMLFAHIRYERQRTLKSAIIADALRRIGRLDWKEPIICVPSAEEGYRLRARLHLDRKASHIRLGFYREGSHTLCDPAPTRQLAVSTLEFLTDLEGRLSSPSASTVSAVELAENLSGDARALHFDMEHPPPPADLSALANGWGDVLGVSYGPRDSRSCRTLWGHPWISEPVVRVPLVRHARAFFQANRFMLDPLVTSVSRWLESGDVLDLYSGVGVFAANVAADGNRRVVAVEGDPISGRDLMENAKALQSIEPHQSSAEDYLEHATPRCKNLVLDPPRVGISKRAMNGIVRLNAHRIVYVSCDVATLARDVRTLLDAGYRLMHVEGFDMFPNTGLVETLAVMVRSSDSPE